MPKDHPRSSRLRYRRFVEDYKRRRLEDPAAVDNAARPGESPERSAAPPSARWRFWQRAQQRDYVRDYLQWLRPHRRAVIAVFVLALLRAGLEMVGPLFMRFIIDRVLLNRALDTVALLRQLHVAGALFFVVIVFSTLVGATKDYRQRVLNTRVMLSLRRSLFERLLYLPMPRLWEMKTGGILSRLTGDVDTTTGLMQMALVSPLVSAIRLVIAVFVLMALNWRLALAALAIIPGVMAISLIFARRVRPIYRSVRKDAERIDGRVGETFSGIRVVRAFRREVHELLEYMRGRHTVVRKELFAHRREMVIW